MNSIKAANKLAKKHNKSMLKAAFHVAEQHHASHLFLFVDAFDLKILPPELPNGLKLVFLTQNKNFAWEGSARVDGIFTLPALPLGRLGMLKYGIILAISAKVVDQTTSIVFLGGRTERGTLDLLLTFRIDSESEMLTGTDFGEIADTVTPTVLEHTLGLAVELSSKGREGKPVGTIFVLGDEERVIQLSKQMIINPFKGYDQEERNLLNPSLKDTLIEFSALDGAFVISGDGEVITAGRYLGAAIEESEIPRGLGARHIAAAGITALTNAVAIVISESTGDVRIFRKGKVIMTIEKSPH